LRVLIVDDHPIVVSGCRALLAGDAGIEIAEAADGPSGYEAYVAFAPDVAVIDIGLPGLSGFELTRRILSHDPAARIVIFSMNDDPAFAARALEAGAQGYIVKNDDPMLFADALRKVAGGGIYLPVDLARKLAFSRPGDILAQLSARELEILRLLAAGDTMAAIADRLNISYKTVANNCTALKQKLHARSSMDLMRVAIETLARQA
jgi:two-component system, NarL family, invasion response regulator UvrY